jgi:hypothetical protein
MQLIKKWKAWFSCQMPSADVTSDHQPFCEKVTELPLYKMLFLDLFLSKCSLRLTFAIGSKNKNKFWWNNENKYVDTFLKRNVKKRHFKMLVILKCSPLHFFRTKMECRCWAVQSWKMLVWLVPVVCSVSDVGEVGERTGDRASAPRTAPAWLSTTEASIPPRTMSSCNEVSVTANEKTRISAKNREWETAAQIYRFRFLIPRANPTIFEFTATTPASW